MDYVLFLLLITIPDVFPSPEEDAYVINEEYPGNLIPISYSLHMHIDPNSDEFWGIASIFVICKEKTRTIEINADISAGLNILVEAEVSVHSKTNMLRKKGHAYNSRFGKIDLMMEKSLQRKRKYLVKIPFFGTMSEKLTGLIRVKDGKGYSVILNLKRTNVLQLFPYIGDINTKIQFTLMISHAVDPQLDTQILSNTMLSSRVIRKYDTEEIEEITFMETDMILIYQLSFIVSRSEKNLLARTQNPIIVNFWGNTDSNLASQFMDNIFDPPISVLERSLGGGNYRTNEIDYVFLQVEMEINVETPGLIIKREKDYQNEAEKSEENAQRFLTESMEKQIFGGTLVPESWWESWLLDCLAKYSSYLLIPHTDSRRDLVSQMLSVMRSDSKRGSKKLLDHFVEDEEDSPTKLGKGFLILLMMDYLVGTEKMKKDITEFVISHTKSYKDVDLYNFLDVVLGDFTLKPTIWSRIWSRIFSIIEWLRFWKITNVTPGKGKKIPDGISAQTIIRGWINQGGYPVIHVVRTKSTVTVTQSRFYSDTRRVVPLSDECWWIPLTWTTNADDSSLNNFNKIEPMAWLGCNTKHSSRVILPVKPDHWILFSSKLPYMCRVDYDRGSWLKIKEILNDRSKYSKIPVENRALLINDALVLSYSGGYGIDLETAFQLVSYLRHDTATNNDVVWLSFLDGMEKFKRTIEKKDIYKTEYKDFMQFILKNIYKEIFPSANKVKSYIEDDIYDPSYAMKSLIYKESCSSGVPDCLQHSTEMYNEWKSGQLKITEFPKRLSRDIFTSVLCSEIGGNPAEVDHIVEILISADTSDIYREILLDGMSCLKDVDKMTWAFDWCLNTEEETIVAMKNNLFVKFLKGPYTYVEASNYFFNNYEKIAEYFRKWAEKRIPSAMPSFVKTIICETDIYVESRLKRLFMNVEELRTITEEETAACDQRYNEEYLWLVENKTELQKGLQSASLLKR